MDFILKKNGFRIIKLVYTNELCQLKIKLLQDAKEAEEACGVRLCAERWNLTNSRSADSTENMLDKLQPPECL
ncbi:hypothetical protein IEQ34_003775 [Dendrobium chrysotoxum]|uniref:Uncharacterized protein n=1 Tax=Dendrobium chrysotoxum TaxID=161865 RepID=A0AAV7HE01_DENCH|nr:hypothetical protein IEQ34_003775 [Dendrobium chrysotoxum]